MKKHSCRMTDTEKEMHDRAVKIRKMTDEQLCKYIDDTQGKNDTRDTTCDCWEDKNVDKKI